MNKLLKLFLITNIVFVSNLFAMKRSSEDSVDTLKNEAINSVYEVGLRYLEQQNYREAFRFFSFAKDTDCPGAIYYIALMTLNGWGIKQNHEEAYRLFNILAKNGRSDEVYNLALRYLNGEIKNNPNDAFNWFEWQTEDEHNYYFEWDFKNKNEQGDLTVAFHMFVLLAQNQHAGAIYCLGMIYFSIYKNFDEAIRMFNLAAQKGDVGAMYMVAINNSDEEEAFKWHTKAMENGHIDAIGNLAESYHSGIGVDIDDDKALSYALEALGDYYFEGDMECLIDSIYESKKDQYRMSPEN